ncbi:hypothetical protein ABUE31_22795, partial [Mesorhizobium sp. ZMM04-5]
VMEWMLEKQKWKLPKTTQVIAPLLPKQWSNSVGQKSVLRGRPINEIVLPSTCDYRDGLVLACDAFDKLCLSYSRDLTISIVGIFGKILGEHTGGMVLRRARNWPFHVNLMGRMEPEEVLRYVTDRNCAVLMSGYSASTNLWAAFAIERGIPLVSTDGGGLPEYMGVNST